MNKEEYIICLNSPTLNSLNGEPNKELLYDFYKKFEGFYLTHCNPENAPVHFSKKVKSKKLVDNFSPLLHGKISGIPRGGKNAVSIELKVSNDKIIKGKLIKEKRVFQRYTFELENQRK